jgi:site-specific recombinase XerD
MKRRAKSPPPAPAPIEVTAIVRAPDATLARPDPEVERLAERVAAYRSASKAKNTVRSYKSDCADFEAWCRTRKLAHLPATPATVALYLAHLADAGRKVSTITRRISAISQAHQLAGHDTPTTGIDVRATMAGIRREHGTAQTAKAPVLPDDLRTMVALQPHSALGARNRALLLIGWASASRRSELVSLDVRDVEVTSAGLRIMLRRSKTDQEGEGRVVGIPRGRASETCPVRALEAWLAQSGVREGPLFRPLNRWGHIGRARLSDMAVFRLVKTAAEAAGLDPKRYAGHSLRAGLATSAAIAGKSERAIMDQTGHKSVKVARRYIRDGQIFRDNAADGLL